MENNQTQISSEKNIWWDNLENDISREWLTFSKTIQFARVLFSKRATQVLDSVETFMDINFEELMLAGKTTIILDFDDCVAEHHWLICAKNFARIIQLQEAWWKIIINSNMKKSDRYDQLEELGIQVFTSKFAKPHRRNFEECLKKIGSTAEESIMIWDNFLTDWGSITAKISFIKVKPIPSSESQKSLPRKFQIFTRQIADRVAELRGHI